MVTTSNGTMHFDISSSGKTDYHCEAKKTLFIQELQPALNVNISSEILLLYQESRFSIVSLHRQFPFETPISTADVFRLGSRPPLHSTV